MHPGQVVVLHEVLGDELPVRLDLVLDASDEALLAEPVAGEPLGQVAELLAPARGAAGSRQTKTRQPHASTRTGWRPWSALSNALTPLMSKMSALVLRDARLRREERRPEARAVEVVRPGVVRALEEPLDLPRLDDELRPAVTADVVVRAELSLAVPADDDRAAGDLDDEERARALRARR